MSAGDPRQEGTEPLYVIRGDKWDVAMSPSMYRKFQKFPTATRAALEGLMEIFGSVGPEHMPQTQLAAEGRHPRGDGKMVFIRAFKDGCFRVYGGHVNIRGKATFVCTAHDDNKKKRKADPEILARAAKNLRTYFELFGETPEPANGAKEGDADEKAPQRQGGKRRKGR